MNWEKFVSGEKGVGAVRRVKSHGYALLSIVNEVAENNTLANWVRETDHRLTEPKQLTLRVFA